MSNRFIELNSVDCSGHTERKGKFDYLSWPFAVKELCTRYPNAIIKTTKWNDVPFLATECGYFVEVSVTVDDVTRTQLHPVLDSSNRPIKAPNAFDINTSIQRCMVKAIALHGLGLHVYAGEDLPKDERPIKNNSITPAPDEPVSIKDMQEKLVNMIGDKKSAGLTWKSLGANDEQRANAVFLLKDIKEIRVIEVKE